MTLQVYGGRAYVFCNRDGISNTITSLEKSGFTFLNLLVWDKKHFGGGYHWRNQVEYIVYVSKGKPDIFIKGAPNIFTYSKPKKSDAVPSIGYNPTGTSPKPYYIWRDIIKWGAIQGDVCADPFAGSDPLRAALLLDQALANKVGNVYTNSYET